MGDAFVRPSTAEGGAVSPSRPLSADGVPHARPIRSNVVRLAPRELPAGAAPLEALHRLRIVAVLFVWLAALLVGIVGWRAGAPAVLLTAMPWFAVEAVRIGARHDLEEFGQIRPVLRRHVGYAMTACTAGVLLGAPAAALGGVYALTALAGVETAGVLLLRRRDVRRWLGVPGVLSVLVVGDRWSVEEAVADRVGLGSSSVVGVCVAGGVDRAVSVAGVPVLGGLDDVVGLAARLRVAEVAVAWGTSVEGEWLRELGWSLERLGARLTVVTRLRDTAPGRVRVSRVGGAIALGVVQARPAGVVRRLKAVVEGLVAVALLVVALPVLVVCAVAVRLDSAGPAFFRQERVREGGRTFRMLKLRTMQVDAESRRGELEGSNEVGGGLFKMRADPRVTRVGRVLRKLSLDELPQLVNVVRGEMSLVGPRPALPSEVATYDRRVRRRLDVKPGLTGLWQVSGRSRLSWDESVSLDLDYVDNWSAGRDVRIALSTIRAVMVRDGAF